MINSYCFENRILKELSHAEFKSAPSKAVWIDMAYPSQQEEALVEALLNIDIPTQEEMKDISLSSRLYQRNQTVFSTLILLKKSDTPHPESHAVTFILHNDSLITVRYVEGTPYSTFLARQKHEGSESQNGRYLLTTMLGDIVDKLADILEDTTLNIESLSRQIFDYTFNDKGKVEIPNYQKIIIDTGLSENLLSKSRESLFTMTRMLIFLLQTHYFRSEDDKATLAVIIKDIDNLIEHGNFLSTKLNFLLDATMGRINIDQNQIIKIVSVVALVMLPPTLIASIYGMNFEIMPELKLDYGYLMALAMMIISAYLPYKYFKFKGWL